VAVIVIAGPRKSLRQKNLLKCRTEAQRHGENLQFSASLCLCVRKQFSRIRYQN